MIDLDLYVDNSLPQKKATREILPKYEHLLQWNSEEETIMDIGCGDGWVTVNILIPFLKYKVNNATLRAVDIDDTFVRHARKRYGNSRITFDVMDVSSDEETEKFANSTDKIFSFFCLQWCPDIKIAFKNIQKMLKRDGCFFAILPCRNNTLVYMYNTVISKIWKAYVSEQVKEMMNKPMLQLENPDQWLRSLLEECNFNVVMCKVVQDVFTFSNFEQIKDFILTFPGICEAIPDKLRDLLFEEMKAILRRKVKSYVIPADCILVICTKK